MTGLCAGLWFTNRGRRVFFWVGGSGLWNIDLELSGVRSFVCEYNFWASFFGVFGGVESGWLGLGGLSRKARCWVLKIRLRFFGAVQIPVVGLFGWLWGLGSLVV